MPAFDLPAAAKRNGLRRNATLRPIEPTQSHAQELAALYLAVVRAWQRGARTILAGYTVPTLDNLTAGDYPEHVGHDGRMVAAPTPKGMDTRVRFPLVADAPRDNAAAIAATEGEVSRLIVEFTAALRTFGVRVERWHRSKWTSAVKAGTGIDLSAVLTAFTAEETLEAFLERNVALVKDISGQAKGRISDAVFRAYQNRTPARVLAKEIAEATGMARKRALRVASDQSSKLSSALDSERQAEAGIEKVKWRSSHKANPRPHHAARDGKIYYLKSRKAVNGGETVPAGDWCGQPPWCGCRAQAYLDIMDELENA